MTVLDVLQAVESRDPEAANELLRIATYEALCDAVDADREAIEADLYAEAAARNDDMRRVLVRKFIDARLSKAEVDPYLQAAVYLTEMDYEISKGKSKGKGDSEDDPNTLYWDKRKGGEFAPRGSLKSVVDPIAAFAREPDANRHAGAGDKIRTGDRYQNAQRLGSLLGQVDHPAAQGASIAASVIGVFGPEAEDVLGPSMRRTAYRYRGTERRPDANLLKDMNFANGTMRVLTDPKAKPEDKAQVKAILGDDIKAEQLAGKPFDGEKRPKAGGQPHISLVNHHRKGRAVSEDQRMLQLRADVATHYLMDKIPSMNNAELSMKAGKVPPSQGVLIDRDGNVVSQAVGFNGDHYLPFDLKNLKLLQGGQYVRTRVQGGPTTEDIYTGLITGARQMTVASNAGIFTVEFDPDLRGGRRYNDKARQMVDRYKKILATIEAKEATVGEATTAAQRQDLKREAMRLANHNPARARVEYTALLQQAEDAALFAAEDADDEVVGNEARRRVMIEAQRTLNDGVKQGQASAQSIARDTQGAKGEVRREAADRRYRTLQLDGPGYKRAMDALQEEFPYFVRNVDFVPLEKFQADRNLVDPQRAEMTRTSVRGKDRGFVKETDGEIAYESTGLRSKTSIKGTPRVNNSEGSTDAVDRPTINNATDAKQILWGEVGSLRPEVDRAARISSKNLKAASGGYLQQDDVDKKTVLEEVVNSAGMLVKWMELLGIRSDDLRDQFLDLDDERQESLIDTLQNKMSMDTVYDGAEGDAPEFGAQLADYLRAYKPFIDGDEMDPVGVVPLWYPEIAKLGPDVQAHDTMLAAFPDGLWREQSEAYQGMDEQDIKDDIEEAQRVVDDAAAGAKDDAVGDLERKHKAWAWNHSRKMAEVHGKPDGPGKVGAPQAPGQRQADLVTKNQSVDEARVQRLLRALEVLRG